MSYSKSVITAAVELSAKYITDRHLPDKAIDVMDEAGARARIQSLNRPPEIEALTKEIETVCAQKEDAIAKQHFEEAAKFRDKEKQLRAQQEKALEDWKKTREDHRIVLPWDDGYESASPRA